MISGCNTDGIAHQPEAYGAVTICSYKHWLLRYMKSSDLQCYTPEVIWDVSSVCAARCEVPPPRYVDVCVSKNTSILSDKC
jgi:hypothetical protein